MSKNPKGANSLAAVQRADRNRKIMIQVAVAVVLIALVAAIGIGLAIKNADSNGNGAAPASTTDSGAIRLGKPEADVTVRVIADMQCPACKMFEQANSDLLKERVEDGSVAVEYNIAAFLDKASTTNFSSRAANASYCVAEAGTGNYQTWLQEMFAQQPPEGGAGLPDEKMVEIAESAGYDDPAVGDCITNNKHEDYVQSTSKDLLQSGIEGTPSIFVNDKKIESQQEVFGKDGLDMAISEAAGQ